MIKNFISKVINMLKLLNEKGFTGLSDRILRWTWRTSPYVIVCKSLSDSKDVGHTDEVQFRTATEDDVPFITQNMSHQGDKAEKLTRQYLHGDDITIIGSLKENPGKLAFLLTMTPRDFGVSLLGDVVSLGDVGVGRIWVPPELRSSGIGAHGCLYAEYVANQKGVNNLWAFVLENNAPSRRMLMKSGYVEVGNIYLVMRFGSRFAKIKRSKDNSWWSVRVPTDVSAL